jgi:hypothetical protein
MREEVDRGLLKKDIVPDGKVGMPRLIEAAMRGDTQTVLDLVELADTNINELDDESMSALHRAAAYEETKIIQILLKDKRTDPLITNKRGGTALHQATVSGAEASVRELLKNETIKKSIDFPNMWGETALILAATRGDSQIAFTLLQNGADKNVRDQWGKSAEEVAKDYGESDAYIIIRDFTQGMTYQPVEKKQVVTVTKKIMSKMIEAPLNEEFALGLIADENIDINGADYYKLSAIHKIAAWEKGTILKELLRHPDIIVDKVGTDGENALHIALSNCAVHCAEILIQDGRIDVNLANDSGVTPLMMAACVGDESVFNLILEKTKDLNGKNKEGKTAWHFAKECGNEHLAKLLPESEPIKKVEVTQKRQVKKLNPQLIAVQEQLSAPMGTGSPTEND